MNLLILAAVLIFLLQSSVNGHEKPRIIKKRQIYREQVLPHAGGKIPDTAFQTDRLLLNRLQKEGFALPDGVILEQRNPQVHPYFQRVSRPVYRVEATQDGRYTPVEGRYIYRIPPGIETTYLYPQIHNVPLRYPPSSPVLPQIRPLLLPNPAATDNFKSLKLSNKKNKDTVLLFTIEPRKTFGTGSFLNLNSNLVPPPLVSSDIFAPTTSIFSNFDSLFGGYTYRVIRSPEDDKKENFTESNIIIPKFNKRLNYQLNTRKNRNYTPFSATIQKSSGRNAGPMMPFVKGS